MKCENFQQIDEKAGLFMSIIVFCNFETKNNIFLKNQIDDQPKKIFCFKLASIGAKIDFDFGYNKIWFGAD